MFEHKAGFAGAFLKRGNVVEDIGVGSRYRHRLPDGTAETAIVAALFYDLRGIPHVSFDLVIARPGGLSSSAVDRRVLALKAFCNRYVEPALGWRGGSFGVVSAPAVPAAANQERAPSLQSHG
jgi:hypothetical protein